MRGFLMNPKGLTKDGDFGSYGSWREMGACDNQKEFGSIG
jgi:hypothetical protein